jgi:hypothetical protein
MCRSRLQLISRGATVTDDGGFIGLIRMIRGCGCIKVAIIAPRDEPFTRDFRMFQARSHINRCS